MTKVILFQRTIFPIILIITFTIIPLCKSEALYMQKCYDAECSVQISKAKTLSMYVSNHPSVLSFGIGESVNVYSKGATDDYYWGVEIRGKRGLAPERFLRESNVMHKNLSHIVPFPLKSPLSDHEQSNKSVKAENNQQKTDVKSTESTEKATAALTESPEEKLPETPDIQASPLQSVVDGTTLPIDYFATQNIDVSITTTDLPLPGIRPVVTTSTDSINLIPDKPFVKEQANNLEQHKKNVNGASNDNDKAKEHHVELMPAATLPANGAQVPDIPSENNVNGDVQKTYVANEPLDNGNIKQKGNKINPEGQLIAEDNKIENKTYAAADSNDSPQTLSVSEEIKVTESIDVSEKIIIPESHSEGKDKVSIADNNNHGIETESLPANTTTVGVQNTLPTDEVVSQSVPETDKADEAAKIDSQALEDNNSNASNSGESAVKIEENINNSGSTTNLQDVKKELSTDISVPIITETVNVNETSNVKEETPEVEVNINTSGNVTDLQDVKEELSTDNSSVNSLLQGGINDTVMPVEDSISATNETANIQTQEAIVDNYVNTENILLNNGEPTDNNVTTDILKEDNEKKNLLNREELKEETYVSSHPDESSDTNIFFGNRNLLHVEEDVHKKSETRLDTVTNITHEEHNVDKTSAAEISTQEEHKTQQSSEFHELESTEPTVETIKATAEDSAETGTTKQETGTSSYDLVTDNRYDFISDNLSNDDNESSENNDSNEDLSAKDQTQSVEYTPEYNVQEAVPSFSSPLDVCMADQECNSDAKGYNQEYPNEEESAVITMKKITHRNYWETLLYVGISALTTLVFSLGYYYIENMRRDSQLIAKINKLEKDLLISTKECVALEETLKSTKTKLTSIEDESFGSNEMVLSLKADLEALQNVKAELEDQNAMLEKELESATEAGLELERMLREVLSSNNEVNPLAQSVEDLQARLNAQQAANESMTNSIALKTQEIESLSSELSALKKNYKDREAEVTRLTNELTNETTLKNSIEETLNNKIQRLEARVKDLIAEKSALHKELKQKEEEAKDLLEVINQFNANNLDLEKLYDVSRIKAEASQLREERDELKVKLNMVEGAHLLLEEHMKVVKEEISALSDQCRAAEKEKKDAETRLEVLSNFFNEKEAQRQKQEAIWLQKQGEVMSTVERIHTMQNEIENYKQQIEILKREIVDQEREYKGQISALETKVHEQWVVARQTERRLEESKVEAGQLRNRLTLIEKNMNDVDPEVKLHRLEANGETTTSPALFIGAESSSSPIMFSSSSNVPPPPPPSYMFGPPPLPPYLPPPPPSGSHVSPYDISQRPPPLGGRLSSPPPIPPPPLHPPPPPTSSGRYDNTTSSPPPLSPQLLPPYDRHRSPPPPPHGMFPPDHRSHHPSFPPPPPPPGSILPPPPPGATHPWGNETLPPLRNFGFHPNQQREQRPRNHKGSLHSSGESLDKSHHSGKV